MEQKNRNNKLFIAIGVILLLLIFSTQTAFIWANNPDLKVKLSVVGGSLLLIFTVLTLFLLVRIRQASKVAKLQTVFYPLLLLWYVMTTTSSFIQNRSLRWILLGVEGSVILVICVLAWLQRKAQKKE